MKGLKCQVKELGVNPVGKREELKILNSGVM